jgi:hypothetical protein
MSTEPKRQSALRGIWTAIFFAGLCMFAGRQGPDFWGGGDAVSDLFRWFFSNFGLYAGLALLVFFVAAVADRVEKGDPIKGDAALLISVVGLIVSVLSLLPESTRAGLYRSISGG